ncbi:MULTISPECIES: DEAD/DEAH box helicase family protein [unclassified Bartonella]|uniref:DEAD/DEAH box helicase family protein n=1 Tax=unclassified Bartonella TaxID=2645622 RepID=UPI0035D0F5E1
MQKYEKVCDGLKEADRGKLIVACGTEKIFISFKIAQQITRTGKRVLFFVPFLALMSQNDKRMDTLYRSAVSFLCGVF